jgi:hypothetical protein
MSKTDRLIMGSVLFLGVTVSEACGPEFPLMLTTCRSRCLSEITAPGFTHDANLLTQGAPVAPPARESHDDAVVPTSGQWEAADPEPGAARAFAAMRKAADGEAAYPVGSGLSEAKRLYTAGAVEFNRIHPSVDWGESLPEGPAVAPADLDAGLTAAIGWFERVLALPDAAAEPRRVWATYMIGRSRALRGRTGDEAVAASMFRQTVALAAAGHEDPLGLGNAALGELARLSLQHQQYREAASLYVQQCAAGSGHASDSLWRVAGTMARDEETVTREIVDPLVQKLLIGFALSTADGSVADPTPTESVDATPAARTTDASRIVSALAKLPTGKVQWPDQVAALALAVGNADFAGRVLKGVDTPYAEWVRAKLALHAGDMEGAAKAFARASRRFAPTSQPAVERGDIAARVLAESGVFSLSRGDYVEALYQLSMAPGFEDDGRYIAERVLTPDELKSLVDREAWARPYRDLLARRLARAGRVMEAIPYYDQEPTRAVAVSYAAKRHQAEAAPTPVAQAEGWFRSAQLEISSGMELTGSEQCPDFAEYQGAFGGPPCDPLESGPGSLVSEDEVARFQASATDPDVRYHYRTLAVRHLFAAADLLPRKSTILSVVLCNGASWLESRHRSDNEDLIKSVYRRYVKDGRSEPWAANFGANCPEPAFPGIAAQPAAGEPRPPAR